MVVKLFSEGAARKGGALCAFFCQTAFCQTARRAESSARRAFLFLIPRGGLISFSLERGKLLRKKIFPPKKFN